MTLRIVIADDDDRVRASFSRAIGATSDLTVVGLARSGATLIRLAAAVRCDLAIVDLRMPGSDCATVVARLHDRLSQVRVLVITAYDTDSRLPRAFAAGAVGYVLKTIRPELLVATVRLAMAGGPVHPPEELARIRALDRPGTRQPLTVRELEVLRLVSQGMCNREVASHLHIGHATVRMHLQHAYAKLGVHNRAAAIAEALRHDLI
jgi:DNA-binding NarL/FixJ family response regulator